MAKKGLPLRAHSPGATSRALGRTTEVVKVDVQNKDVMTGAVNIVDYAHHEVHSGSHYQYLDTHALAKAGSIEHLVITPDTDKLAHFTITVMSLTSTVLITMFEDTVYSDPGDIEPMINRNRNFPDNNTTLLYENPTVTNDGQRLSRVMLGAGRNSNGGSVRDELEIVLKRNTAYLIRVVEQDIEATDVNLNFDWYEHTYSGN